MHSIDFDYYGYTIFVIPTICNNKSGCKIALRRVGMGRIWATEVCSSKFQLYVKGGKSPLTFPEKFTERGTCPELGEALILE